MDGNCPNGQRCVLTNNGYQKTCVSGEYIFMIIMIMLMIIILTVTVTVTVTVILIAMVIVIVKMTIIIKMIMIIGTTARTTEGSSTVTGSNFFAPPVNAPSQRV